MRGIKRFDFCACGQPAQEIHHSSPSFDDIVTAIFERHPAHVEAAINTYDWRVVERFSIDPANPLRAAEGAAQAHRSKERIRRPLISFAFTCC
jgi:hypothetical protein